MQTNTATKCTLGFKFDNLKNNCQREWTIAGTSNGTENLKILCSHDGYDFDVISESCVVPVGVNNVISFPLVCDNGMKLDHKGVCKESWDG